MSDPDDPNQAPPAKKGLLVLAGALLVIPCLALVPVGWYSSAGDPRAHDIAGWPIFFWFQLLLVPITALMTVSAYEIVKRARPPTRPGRRADHTAPSDDDQPNRAGA